MREILARQASRTARQGGSRPPLPPSPAAHLRTPARPSSFSRCRRRHPRHPQEASARERNRESRPQVWQPLRRERTPAPQCSGMSLEGPSRQSRVRPAPLREKPRPVIVTTQRTPLLSAVQRKGPRLAALPISSVGRWPLFERQPRQVVTLPERCRVTCMYVRNGRRGRFSPHIISLPGFRRQSIALRPRVMNPWYAAIVNGVVVVVVAPGVVVVRGPDEPHADAKPARANATSSAASLPTARSGALADFDGIGSSEKLPPLGRCAGMSLEIERDDDLAQRTCYRSVLPSPSSLADDQNNRRPMLELCARTRFLEEHEPLPDRARKGVFVHSQPGGVATGQFQPELSVGDASAPVQRHQTGRGFEVEDHSDRSVSVGDDMALRKHARRRSELRWRIELRAVP